MASVKIKAPKISHTAWASGQKIVVEDYGVGHYLVKCPFTTFPATDAKGKPTTETEQYPWAVIERGYVRYFETEDEARLYAHEHALDLILKFRKE